MTDQTPTEEPALDEGQQAYESLFGRVPEWHEPSTTPPSDELDEDDAIYRAIYGA